MNKYLAKHKPRYAQGTMFLNKASRLFLFPVLFVTVFHMGLATTQAGKERGRVIYNLDCTEFFVGTFGPNVPETIDKFVDEHATAGITDLFVNVNAQRTNYRSQVWEAFWDGYDPSAGVEQSFFSGIPAARIAGPDANDSQMYINMYELSEMGCDYAERMLARARHHQVGAWISLRMNDGHSASLPDHPSHSVLWKSHPEWRLTSGYGLDYEQPEVREHYQKLIAEVCSRYDIDGLELDFQRFWLYFRKGREQHGTKLMLKFMQEARAATATAAKRLGHPVKLAVRVPGNPWTARRHGLDAIAWARVDLIDMIIAGSFWFSTNSDVPVETWQGLLRDTEVEVAVHLEDGIDSGASGRRTMTHEEMRGIMVSALHRGADAIYFFNLFTGPLHRWPRADHDRLIDDAGSYKTLCANPRRHALTITNPWSPGETAPRALLPYTGKHGMFRLHSGPRPASGQQASVEIEVPTNVEVAVRLNGVSCPGSVWVDPLHIRESGWEAESLESRQSFRIPPDAINDGYNLVEVISNEDVTTKWVEIYIR